MHDVEWRAVVALELVCIMQAAQRIGEDMQTARQAELGASLTAAQDAMERLALEIFHGEEMTPARLAHLERLHDIGMIQPGRQARFVQEHPNELRIFP